MLPNEASLPPDGDVVAPLIATAACLLSGGLDDAQSLDDLRECMEHFATLYSSEVIDDDQLNHEVACVFEAVRREYHVAVSNQDALAR